MQLHKWIALLAASGLLSTGAVADTLTFAAQPVSGGGIDYSWFNAANWFTTDSTGNLVPAGRVPLDNEQAIITGAADLGAGGVRIQTLVETNNATLTNGTVAVENLQLLSGSTLGGATVNVLSTLRIGGTNCTLQNATLTLFGIAAGNLAPVPPATAASLVLTQGSALQVGGFLNLTDGSQITGGGMPQSKLSIAASGALSSTNSTSIRGSAGGHLIFDNSGLVRVDGGTLTFSDGIDWQATGGAGEFNANSGSALILFSNVFHADNTVTSFFTGPGTNRWLAGATIDGLAQVSAPSPSTQLAGMGNLEILGPVTGAGTLRALGTTNQGGVAIWSGGSLSVGGVEIDPGAGLLIPAGSGASRVLAACTITNQGTCTVLGGRVDFSQGAIFNNQTNALFSIQGAVELASPDNSGTFNNVGTVLLEGGSLQFGDTNSTSGPAFNNSSLVDLRAGQLDLLAGSSSGEFRQAPGTLLWFWGDDYTLNAGAGFTGSNSLRVAQAVAPARCLLQDGFALASVEVGTNGILDASGMPVGKTNQIQSLLTRDNGSVSNGTFQVQSLEMLNGSDIALAGLSVNSALRVGGSSCSLAGSTVTLAPGAFGLLQSAEGATGATLNLTQGAVLRIGGQLALMDGSQITGTGLPQSRLSIQPGGLLETTNSASLEGTTNAHLIVDNSGTILSAEGTLTLADGLDWQSSAAAGDFAAATPDALLLFTGAFQVNAGNTSFFTGPGTSRWLGGCTINGAAQVGSTSPSPRPGNVEIAGPVSGAGSVHVLGGSAQPGRVSWSSGLVSLSHIDVDAAATLLIGGAASASRQLSGGAMNNSGSCVFSGGDLALGQGAVVNNLGGGTLLLETNVALRLPPGAGPATLNNAGTLLQGPGVTLCSIGADFRSSGNVEIKSGTLQFQGSWQQTQGTTTIDAGAALDSTNLTLQGGTVTGSGTIHGQLANFGGNVSPGAGVGILSTDSGSDYQQGPAGSLTIELAGTAPASQYDQLAIGGNAFLDGQLQLKFLNGFIPVTGETFQVLTCRALTGKFAGVNVPALSGGVWVPHYTATNISLTLAAAVQLSRPVVSGNSLNFPLNTTAGILYVVQASDSLAQPNWQTTTTFTGDGTVRTISDTITAGTRFYRVLLE